ncbi:MAG TPA: hypothetical protein VEC19_01960 [Usitatibacter sp.]|nr:hypothetical protein [Usitatibacter sp.]
MKTTKSTNRRNFLMAAGLGSAGVAAAIVTQGRGKPAKQAAVAPQPSGYHETEHIRKYYKTTEV